MAKNDKVLLDGIVDDRVGIKLPSGKRDEAFEYLAFEQILKDFDLSRDEILAGSIDGRQDGGIDGFFILVNGHLLQDPEAFVWPRIGSDLKIILVTCKHHDTFRQATLDSIIATLTEVLDFGVEDLNLKGAYSSSLLRMRSNLRFAYRKLSPRLSRFSVDIYYASRGDTADIGEEVRSRGRQIENLVREYFGSGQATFEFLGCTELVEIHRRIPNYSLELPFVEALAKGERYVVLVRLSDYYDFVSDDGKLRRYLFESNVRDFMGLNRVNEDIKATLENPLSPDFWWLNNGVTILATAASITGKSIQVADIQIVNGLQTTESIFRYFSENPKLADDRSLLVKVIVSKEETVRDSIIRATNNQTDVELASLHATDKIQRDIEDVMLRHGLFYERRKNFYANQGHTPAEIVTPLYAAAGYVALMLKQPHRATALRSKFMRSPTSYEVVFSEKAPIEVWPKISYLLKKIDAELENLRPQAKWTDKFLKGWRYILAFLMISESAGKYTFSAAEIMSFDVESIDSKSVGKIWRELEALSRSSAYSGGWSSRRNVVNACIHFANIRGIDGIEMLKNKPNDFPETPRDRNTAIVVSEDIVEKIKLSLPPQPWKPGLHKKISAEVGCDIPSYFAAVDRLIEDGTVLRQKDGVLYDLDGNVVLFDPERVNPETLELIKP
ncbi:hypothetical protein J2W28_004185 [Variovorax boronicumulans]|uniref:AIPR family protein n=1 Tax=Variovorax boronicumulans TaxID=436515 RepID=UPI00277E529C|nr:AIPR family protein [Variovorax boronicumulans]MDP9993724.1 hypothetical protein [Variovorax boronicumulans]MDQ0005025.1 hypothetical protein [Variovorax boronicumulans]